MYLDNPTNKICRHTKNVQTQVKETQSHLTYLQFRNLEHLSIGSWYTSDLVLTNIFFSEPTCSICNAWISSELSPLPNCCVGVCVGGGKVWREWRALAGLNEMPQLLRCMCIKKIIIMLQFCTQVFSHNPYNSPPHSQWWFQSTQGSSDQLPQSQTQPSSPSCHLQRRGHSKLHVHVTHCPPCNQWFGDSFSCHN